MVNGYTFKWKNRENNLWCNIKKIEQGVEKIGYYSQRGSLSEKVYSQPLIHPSEIHRGKWLQKYNEIYDKHTDFLVQVHNVDDYGHKIQMECVGDFAYRTNTLAEIDHWPSEKQISVVTRLLDKIKKLIEYCREKDFMHYDIIPHNIVVHQDRIVLVDPNDFCDVDHQTDIDSINERLSETTKLLSKKFKEFAMKGFCDVQY